MAQVQTSPSARVRAQLEHPVVDSDGHYVEITPILEDYIKEAGGADTVQRLNSRRSRAGDWYRMSLKERRDNWTSAPAWWFVTQEATDRATASLPKLLHDRMDELGMDYTVLFPSNTMGFMSEQDDEIRGVLCRAMNTYLRDMFAEFSDRMTPVALIPMVRPQDALVELEYAVKELGLKAVVLSSYAHRPVTWVNQEMANDPYSQRLDFFGIDSEYDYDPVWAKCQELGVSPTHHSPTHGFGLQRSTSNYMHNHLGQLAASAHAKAKSLFFGGVTRRFPDLRFGFMECGVGWACTLFSGIIGNWEKRNIKVVDRLDPARLDLDRVMELTRQYGSEKILSYSQVLPEYFGRRTPPPDSRDDWSACGIETEEDIRDLFVPSFYFGCEADDSINAWAFNSKVNPFGARLNAMFGSDIGHWDVPDMREPVHEAYEMVEDERITETDFHDFVFGNAVRFFAANNPDFFRGTVVERAAGKLLSQGK